VRRYGIKFRSKQSFRKFGWNSDPWPRIEQFYKSEAGYPILHTAPFIWDLKEAIMYDEPLLLTSILLWRKLQKYGVGCIGGIESSAIPIMAGIMIINTLHNGPPLRAVFLRKQRKKDGLRRILEGARLDHNTKIVIVDDILNRGITKNRAINYCSRNKLKIEGILVVLDTNSKGHNRLIRECPIDAIFTKREILSKTSYCELRGTNADGWDGGIKIEEERPFNSTSTEDAALVALVRDTVCITVASQGRVEPTVGPDTKGSAGYTPFLGRYLVEKGAVFVRISKREFNNGNWINRMRGCQCVGLLGNAPKTYAEMAVSSAIATATRARKVCLGPSQFHRPIWSSELGSLSYFIYKINRLIPTMAKSSAELAEEGHNVVDFGLIGISLDDHYRGVICGDLNIVQTIEEQIRAVCWKAQNGYEIRPHRLEDMRFIRMDGRWLYEAARPKSIYF
jgi:orotate phosphoribosyltransferase